MNKIDIILDTNVFFSGLFSQKGASFDILLMIGKDTFDMHLSVPLLFEYEEVLKRQQHILGLTGEDIDDVLNYICSVSILHTLYYSWRPCLNDPDDEMLLEVAIAAGAQYIVTHNVRHFKGIKGFSVKAIKPSEFLKLLEE